MTLVKTMSNNIEKVLSEKVSEFNSRVKEDQGLAKMIEGKDRTITICVSDGSNYRTKLENLVLDTFQVTDDPNTDLVVTATSEVLEALIAKTTSPIKAYMGGNLKVKASFSDLLLLKKLF